MGRANLQISLRGLLGATAAIAAAVGALAAQPSRISGAAALLLACAFPAAFAAGLVSSRGAWRAFCAGAILPAGIGFYLASAHFHGIVSLKQLSLIPEAARDAMVNAELRSLVALYWTAMLTMGLMAAGFHWLFAARGPEEE